MEMLVSLPGVTCDAALAWSKTLLTRLPALTRASAHVPVIVVDRWLVVVPSSVPVVDDGSVSAVLMVDSVAASVVVGCCPTMVFTGIAVVANEVDVVPGAVVVGVLVV